MTEDETPEQNFSLERPGLQQHGDRHDSFQTEHARVTQVLRMAVETAVQEKAKTLAVLESIGDGISIQDARFRVIYQNEAHKKLVGGDKVGQHCYLAYAGNDKICDGCPVEKTFRDGAIHSIEKILRNKADTLHMEIKSFPLRNASGKTVAVIEVARDVTERKRFEDRLYRLNRALQVLSESNRAVMDAEDETDLLNRICSLIVKKGGYSMVWVGYAAQDGTKSVHPVASAGHNKGYLENIRVRWDNTELGRGPAGNAIRTGKTSIFRDIANDPGFAPWREDAVSRGYASTIGLPLSTEDGMIGALIICAAEQDAFDSEEVDLLDRLAAGISFGISALRDRAERKEMEEELFRARKLESLSAMAGGIAHDFNNLLTGVIGSISLARMDLTPIEKANKKLAEAEAYSLKARALAKQLYSFAQSGVPVRQPCTIAALINELHGLSAGSHKFNFSINIPEDLWNVEIDPGQTAQALNNIVINAKEAMPEGGVISIGCENSQIRRSGALPLKPGKYVKIMISDQGCGISKENLPRVFDPYFTTKDRERGFGLSIANAIITKHEGHIGIRSRPGGGSTFTVYLPATEAEPNRAERERIVTGSGRILLMDDEEMIRKVSGEMLRRLGYEVLVASNGEEAIELFQKAFESGMPIDVTVLGLTVPGGIGGRETMERLRLIDPAVKAIVSSGCSNDPVMSSYAKFGFIGALEKPYRIMGLSAAIHKALKGRSG